MMQADGEKRIAGRLWTGNALLRRGKCRPRGRSDHPECFSGVTFPRKLNAILTLQRPTHYDDRLPHLSTKRLLKRQEGSGRSRGHCRGNSPITWTVFLLFTSLWLFVCGAGISHAKETDKAGAFPSKPIKILLPTGAGGTMGQEIRSILPFLEKHLGVGTTVEYVTGAEGIVGYNKFYKEKPDGHTIMYISLSSAVALELTRETAKYVVRDLAPIATWNVKNLVWAVHPDAWKSFPDFVNDARQRKVNVSFMGGSSGLQGRLLETALGLKLNWVPYESGGESISAVAGKHAEAVITFTSLPRPMIRAGKLRALSVFSSKPDPFLPGVPTLKELGYPDVPLLIVYGIFAAPPNTPKEVVEALEKAVSNAAAESEFKKLADNIGIAVEFRSSSEVRKLVRDDYELLNRYKQLIK